MEEIKTEVKDTKCTACKSYKYHSQFINATGRILKTCSECREKASKQREKNKCIHNREKKSCKDCGGSQICVHNRIKSCCKECKGGSICEHKRKRNTCKECGNASQICIHNKHKQTCKECGGASICIHNKRRSLCVDCEGGSICEHKKCKSQCKECEGSQICIHKIQKIRCRECEGNAICEHDKVKYICKQCNGSQICAHGTQKNHCRHCDFPGYLSGVVRGQVHNALNSNKTKHSIEYLDCDIEFYKKHIEDQFEEGMSWENRGEWHIDHTIPIKYRENGEEPSLEEIIKRLHYTNTQPMWAEENISKSNRYIGK
jgi:hypothetical protein